MQMTCWALNALSFIKVSLLPITAGCAILLSIADALSWDVRVNIT